LDASKTASLLGKVEPFRGLDERARLTMVEHAGRRVVDKGQMVFWQDDPGDAMFVLLEGSVKLTVCSKDGELIELHRHDAPATFGELAILDGGRRSASAEAVERSTLLAVTRTQLLRLLRTEEQVAEALLRMLGKMVRRTTRQVSDLAFLNVQGRVAGRLLELARWILPVLGRNRSAYQVLDLIARAVPPLLLAAALAWVLFDLATLEPTRLIEHLLALGGMVLAGFSTVLWQTRSPSFALLYGLVYVLLLIPTRIWALCTLNNSD
jgi:CRP/FNR family transcriptional regulator, cyclic AMP receptor protein